MLITQLHVADTCYPFYFLLLSVLQFYICVTDKLYQELCTGWLVILDKKTHILLREEKFHAAQLKMWSIEEGLWLL